ncbi:MAG: hypothetical protein K6E19_04255 [Lachnospiraceae bacterium]|nr:hypothetical protein [Lachnospiraceae bacterium]
MNDKSFHIQPAVRKETLNVLIYTAIGTVLMWIALFLINRFLWPDVPFDYTVFLGGVGGLTVAVLNFFFMALTVQKVTSTDDDKQASQIMRLSFTRRMLLQVVWMAVAVLVPCFYWLAGLLPLAFPSIGIKIKGILEFNRKSIGQEVKSEQNGD